MWSAVDKCVATGITAQCYFLTVLISSYQEYWMQHSCTCNTDLLQVLGKCIGLPSCPVSPLQDFGCMCTFIPSSALHREINNQSIKWIIHRLHKKSKPYSPCCLWAVCPIGGACCVLPSTLGPSYPIEGMEWLGLVCTYHTVSYCKN